MLYAMIAQDRPDGFEKRISLRADHFNYLHSLGDKVVFRRLVEPKPPLLGLPTTLQKVALISSLQITSVVGPCDEDGEDCPSVSSRCETPCATAGEVNATNAKVNAINLIP
jgi:hypothetical protein